ncbi:MAG: hypothetical protein ACLQBX_15365 [Candidatus Limnocylindrales bacterium]
MEGERPTQPMSRADPALYWTALNQRLRLAYIARAEERCRREVGRPLTNKELRWVLARYPGDLPER